MPIWLLLLVQVLPEVLKLLLEILKTLNADQKKTFARDLKDAFHGDRAGLAVRIDKVVKKYKNIG